MEKITSKSNALIKNVKKLFTSRRARIENNQFVLEGARLCFDVFNSDYKVACFLVTEKAYEKYEPECRRMIEVADKACFISDEVAAKLADTESTQGIFAVCEILQNHFKIEKNNKYIALDSLQDPSNLGAVIRTAEALGMAGAICFNCCDIYNPKALRASMGSILRLPVMISENLCSDMEQLKTDGFSVYAAVPDSDAADITKISFNKSSVMMIGNEGSGISDAVKNCATELVTIHMQGRAESLNASMAGAIAMWEMLR